MQKARSQGTKPLLPLVGTRFQVLFHSPSGVLFTFPSRYWFTIGHGRVCSLGGWSPQLPTGFLVSRRTQVPKPQIQVVFRLQDSHLVSWGVPAHFDYTPGIRGLSPASALQPQRTSPLVWASPGSLAATTGISVDFFSWSYLDVSVHSVGLHRAMYSPGDDEV
jgi:hypothetical protein